jgi:hypothetical protein
LAALSIGTYDSFLSFRNHHFTTIQQIMYKVGYAIQ